MACYRTRMLAYLTLFCLLSSAQADSRPTAADIEEYCEDDYFFKPRCEEDEVVLIGYARYGRMRVSRCTEDGFGHLGCSMDARRVLGSKCSGRRSCEVFITSIPPKNDPPCPKGLRGYLEVTYDCVNVIKSPRGYCRSREVTEVRNQQGYLSSLVAEESGCGSTESPWWVTAKPGQKLRFQLLTFGEFSPEAYAVLKGEPGAAAVSLTTENTEFTSESNRIEVTLINTVGDQQENINFLLKFEATGCPDILPPVNTWVRRNDQGAAIMGCDIGDLQWEVQCINDEWVGDMESCPTDAGKDVTDEPVPAPIGANDEHPFSFLNETNALIIMAAVGVVIVIGVCLLMVGLVYICRRWKSEKRAAKHAISDSRRSRGTKPVQQSLMEEDPEEDYYCPPEGEYYRTWQKTRGANRPYPPRSGASVAGTPLPPPPYTPSGTMASRGTGRWPGQDTEHIYERPTFVIPPQEEGAECDTRSMRTNYKCPDRVCEDCDPMNTM